MSRSVDPEAFGFMVTDLARLIRLEFDRRVTVSGIGITAAEARLLVHVARADGERQSTLAERLGVEAMTVSNLIDRLEARGFVARETDPSDRRAKLVRLTNAADEALDHIQALAGAVKEEAMRGIGAADWSVTIAALKTARLNLIASKAAFCVKESDAA